MSAPTLIRELVVAQSRALKLPGVARVFDGLARQARDAHWPHEDYLHEVLSAEQASRHESVMRQRLRDARFPEVKTLDTFDFTAAEGINATQLHTAPENLIFAGPIRTGKTHLAIALGVEATKQKRRVLFTRAADLVRQLLEARDGRELTRLQQRLLRVDRVTPSALAAAENLTSSTGCSCEAGPDAVRSSRGTAGPSPAPVTTP